MIAQPQIKVNSYTMILGSVKQKIPLFHKGILGFMFDKLYEIMVK